MQHTYQQPARLLPSSPSQVSSAAHTAANTLAALSPPCFHHLVQVQLR